MDILEADYGSSDQMLRSPLSQGAKSVGQGSNLSMQLKAFTQSLNSARSKARGNDVNESLYLLGSAREKKREERAEKLRKDELERIEKEKSKFQNSENG